MRRPSKSSMQCRTTIRPLSFAVACAIGLSCAPGFAAAQSPEAAAADKPASASVRRHAGGRRRSKMLAIDCVTRYHIPARQPPLPI